MFGRAIVRASEQLNRRNATIRNTALRNTTTRNMRNEPLSDQRNAREHRASLVLRVRRISRGRLGVVKLPAKRVLQDIVPVPGPRRILKVQDLQLCSHHFVKLLQHRRAVARHLADEGDGVGVTGQFGLACRQHPVHPVHTTAEIRGVQAVLWHMLRQECLLRAVGRDIVGHFTQNENLGP